MDGQRWSRHNLAVRLLALYLLLVGPILAAAVYFDVLISRRLAADASAADLNLAETVAQETDDVLSKAALAVETFAQMPAIVAADPAGMDAAFTVAAAARPDVNLFYRLDAHGVMLFHHPAGPRSTVGTDFSFRDYFKAARQSRVAVFSQGRISPTTQRPVATVAMPVYGAGGEFAGVVATNLDLEGLVHTLAAIAGDSQQGVRVTILDSAGQVVAHSHPQEQPLLARLDAGPVVARVLAGDRGSLTAKGPGDQEWLYSYAPISTAGWGVLVQRPAGSALAPSRAFHRGLVAAIGLIALGAAMFWVELSRRLIRPLQRLTQFGRAGGHQSDLAVQARQALEAVACRPDQVGELARTMVRMEADLLRRVNELETLLETSSAVVSSLDTVQVLDNILEQIQRLLGLDMCAVRVLSEDGQELQIRASRGLSDRYVHQLVLDASTRQLPSWQAIESGQPVKVTDVENDPAMMELRPRARAEGYRSLLAVPLITRHAPPAVLVVYRTQVHDFTAEEVALAVSFANHAAMALENATLFERTDEELQRQVRSLRALNQVMRTAGQSLVLDDVLNNAVDAVLQVMAADAAWIYLLEEGETPLRLHAQRGFSSDFAVAAGQADAAGGLGGWVAQTGQTLLVHDIRHDERLAAAVEVAVKEGLHSLAAVPLRSKETIVGVLGAATCTDKVVTAHEVELLSAIGSQIGIAVENARLYRRSRQAAILEERNRLAREIHDALAQGLTGIIVQLEATERLAQRRPEQALASMQRAKDLARRSLQEARRSVWGLRPSSLEDVTLAEALQARVDSLGDECSIRASLIVAGTRRVLSPDVETNLFRIAQEALSNVQRHSQAEAVRVQLDYGHSHVRLIVEDNGIGLPGSAGGDGAAGEVPRDGFGLLGMQERVALLGGQMSVSGEPGQGVRVEVIVPA